MLQTSLRRGSLLNRSSTLGRAGKIVPQQPEGVELLPLLLASLAPVGSRPEANSRTHHATIVTDQSVLGAMVAILPCGCQGCGP